MSDAAADASGVRSEGIGAARRPGLPRLGRRRAASCAATRPCAPADACCRRRRRLPPAERRRAGARRQARAGGRRRGVSRTPASIRAARHGVRVVGRRRRQLPRDLRSAGGADRMISPTRFTNSVHNAPAGYWRIAIGAARLDQPVRLRRQLRAPACSKRRRRLAPAPAGAAGRLRRAVPGAAARGCGRCPTRSASRCVLAPADAAGALASRLDARSMPARAGAPALCRRRRSMRCAARCRPRARCRCCSARARASRRAMVLDYLPRLALRGRRRTAMSPAWRRRCSTAPASPR